MARESDWVITETDNPTIIWFAKGGSARVLEILGTKDTPEGKKMGMILQPYGNWRHIYRTQIKKEEYQAGDWIYWEVNPDYIVTLNDSPKTRFMFATCDYHGVPIFFNLREQAMNTQLKNQEGIIRKLKEENQRQAKAFKGVVEQSLIVEVRKAINEAMNEQLAKLMALLKGKREQT